ncbi:MAG: undecaprenyldiphospho-muramoylpentapeptide beta-N-acetylglucosaminyltransferase [Zetaproteobacteria bacterium]|nr:MAG: undecaprenyldiphospho-muramoylpentapeptide beta-N-acetylglucosaminyltransferase [Zetaproteobacteria bacterium]
MSASGMLAIAGGGTGGHVMPALALAEGARKRWPDLHVQFIGAERGLEASLLPARGEKDVLLLGMHGVKGAGWRQQLRVLLWELPCAVRAILRHWRKQRPNVVVGVGGYASASGVIAGLIARVPIVLYEQNAVPGLVNRLLSRVADKIMLGLPGGERFFAARKCLLTGNVVRSSLHGLLYKPHDPPCLLVMGGSQGARFLNERMPQTCARLMSMGMSFSVLHLAGRDEREADRVREAYRKAGLEAKVLGFSDDMRAVYRLADVVVARSGAMSVSELALCGLPALFVPFPAATHDHQYHNARVLVDAGAALVCRQEQADSERLADMLAPLLRDPKRRKAMSQAALVAAVPDAIERQLAVLEAYLHAEEAA